MNARGQYRPRKGSAAAKAAEAEAEQRSRRLAERDAEYRRALGLGASDPLPPLLGAAIRMSRPPAAHRLGALVT